jgi:hypothetical protein
LIVFLILLCYNLPSLPFYVLCLKEDIFRPPHTEVLVSACKSPVATGVPGGEVLLVREAGTDKMYLLDLRTGKKRDVPNDSLLLDHGIFLNSELVWLEGYGRPEDPGYRPDYILDLIDNQRYELLDLTWLPLLDGNKFDPKYYAYFQSAKQVFIHHGDNKLIALSLDFRQHPEGNVIFSQYSLESGAIAKNGEMLEKLMNDLGVDYEIVDLSLKYTDVPSPTGRYIIRSDGIYLSETNMPVVTEEYTGRRFIGDYFVSWYYDEIGMVFQGGGYSLITLPGTSSFYDISVPVLKMRLPEP